MLCYAVLLLRVNFRNLTVVYAEETARFAATMPWLYVAAGYPVGTGGKAIDDPEAAGAIEQVRKVTGDVTVFGAPTSSTVACSEVYAAFVPKGDSWQREALKHSEISLNVRCETK